LRLRRCIRTARHHPSAEELDERRRSGAILALDCRSLSPTRCACMGPLQCASRSARPRTSGGTSNQTCVHPTLVD
jgi:hypothetical protein